MLRGLAEEFITHEGGVDAPELFAREYDADGLRRLIGGGVVYHIAEQDGAIVGFLAIRECKHLFHMFVDKRHHRQGIATALWAAAREQALDTGNSGVFTVNSSNYAVPVYKALGFVRTEPMQFKSGIYYNPIKLDGRHSG